MRTKLSEPANVLRAALSGPFPAIRDAAIAVISRAILAGTNAEAAETLGVSLRTMQRILGEDAALGDARKKIRRGAK